MMPAAVPLRVLMVTGAYFPEISSSGVQCQNMARQLGDRVDVQVLTTAVDPSLPRHDTVDGVPVTRIRVDVRSGLSKLRAARRMILDLWRMVGDCHVVHLHGYSTKNVLVTIVAKIFRKPILMSLHTAGFDEPDVIERNGSLALWAFLSADLYLSVSAGLVQTYLAAGLPPERIVQVPNGIDTDRFAPPESRPAARARLGLPPDRPATAFVGFFSVDKQPRVLFEAWLRLQADRRIDTTLIFVGATQSAYFEVDGSIAEAMQRDATGAGLGDRLVFTGATHQVADYLKAADLFVLPSRREGLPVALLEAMASGLPCIASRLPGSTDTIITHGDNGLLVPPGDVPALADAMAQVLTDHVLAARLGAAARATIARRFASEGVAARWFDAYERLLTLAAY